MRREAIFAVAAVAALAACKHGGDRQQQQRDSGATRRGAPVASAPGRGSGGERGAGAGASRYEVRGTVASAGGGLFGGDRVKIDRAGEPQAELHVDDNTRITLGGQPAKLSDLSEGDEVRATFDMDGDHAVATSIRAERKPRRDAR